MHFTDQIASYIKENELDIRHLTIVLPSERAKKYIATSLFKEFQKPLIAPKMITIDRWVRELSEKAIIDKTRALIRLFEIQLDKAETDIDYSFDEFISWGNMLLSDFDELDRYLLDSKQLFCNLADIKEIENWSFGNENLTEGQKRFLEFWDRLPGYYTALNEKLDKEQSCYMGKAYRFVAENLDVIFKEDKERHFVFAGFNALSPAEISIIKQLHIMGRGHILINADTFYLESESHEAGRFLRDLKLALGVKNLPFVVDVIGKEEKNIEVIECAQFTGQVKVAGTILEKMDEATIQNTLILLADESLIVPLLKTLPRKIGKANITLGLPLRNTSLRSWVDIIFSIQENKKRFKSDGIYFQDIQKIWNHPFISAVLPDDEKKIIVQKEQEIIKRNSIFLSLDKLTIGPVMDQLLRSLFAPWKEDWKTGISLIRQLNNQVYQLLVDEFEFEKAVIQGFDAALIDFENIVSEGLPAMSLNSFKKLFHLHWNQKSIAYHGNPLEGLQIMGLLETRLLDFETIICLGMNEGKMPPTNPVQTMIPMDLRQYFKLPTPREKQGLFAHHFYRLLHSCKQMYITYTSAQEMIGSNEASRYLFQMELELSRMNPNVKISKSFYTIPQKTTSKGKISIPKSPEIIHRLDQLFAKSTSASLLKRFAQCPLDFYYKDVLEFGEEDKVEEEVENNTFGTFIHNALENMYAPFARFDKEGNKREPAPKSITSFDIEHMLKHYEDEIRNQFMIHFNNDKESFTKGKNLLSFKMANELTKRYLEKEKEFLMKQTEPVFIESLERTFIHELELDIFGETKKVTVKGIVDRIDSIGGKIRIIDYKSGKVNDVDTKTNKKLSSNEDIINGLLNKKHVLQLVMYAFLYKQKFNELPKEVDIISFINIQNGAFSLETGNVTLEEMVELFPTLLTMILEQIYNPEQNFEHVEKEYSFCSYC